MGDIERPNTVDTFCNTPHPTEKQFNALEENDKIAAFRNYLKVKSFEIITEPNNFLFYFVRFQF